MKKIYIDPESSEPSHEVNGNISVLEVVLPMGVQCTNFSIFALTCEKNTVYNRNNLKLKGTEFLKFPHAR